MNSKDVTNGYIEINLGETKKWAHFSMVFLKILKENTDKTLAQIGSDMESDNVITRFWGLAEIMYAGFSAYDREEGNQIDYTLEKCMNWTTQMEGSQRDDLSAAMSFAVSFEQQIAEMGKMEREKSPQS